MLSVMTSERKYQLFGDGKENIDILEQKSNLILGTEEFLPDTKKQFGNDGVAAVEIILILVVLIAIVFIFKTEITNLVTTIWKSINSGAKEIL